MDMADLKDDAGLFRALANENNLRLLRDLFDGERAVDELDTDGSNIDELVHNQIIRTREDGGRTFIRINKVGKFRAVGILESYLKTASDMAVCGNDDL